MACSFNLYSGLVIATLFLICNNGIRGATGAAVMSVDLGTEIMKVGVVSPGVPMEIVLNRESKRKTPAILAFRDDVRTFGEDAMSVGIKDPAAAYGYLLDLLGKTIDNPIVSLYRKRFPYYNIVEDVERKTLIFKKSDKEQFTIEELVAQMLVKAKEYTQESTNQLITECVITVPGYFGQAEREALLAAARLANLKVLQLINDYTAVALHHGVFNRAEINETAQYIIFYDMGAYSTTASLVSYQLVKDKQTKEVLPQLHVLGVGFDRTLGGLEIQLRLRDHLATEFNAMQKTKTDVTTSPRALAKLFKEAGRVKNVLSANNDHYAQIENLIEEQDFKIQVTREQLEEMCADLWPRVTKPLEQALSAAQLSLDSISQVIFFGGGTRVPKVQEIVRDAIKREPGKSLNADEAAAMGAVYKAADLATGFKVKKFVIKDAVLFPIHVTFKRAADDENQSSSKSVKRVLFPYMNAYPQKKVITFNKHTQDFDFYVHYGDLEQHYTDDEISYLGSRNISRVMLQKVKELLAEKQNEVVDSKGIKAYFALDDGGLFHCTGVEFVYEKQETVTNDDDDESTLSKLGSTISKLFSKEEQQKETGGNAANENDTLNTPEDSEEQQHADKEKEEVPQEQEQQQQNKQEAQENEAKNETIKLVMVKQPIEHEMEYIFASPLSGEAFKKSADKLSKINLEEEKRNRLQSSFNALESHVIETQQKLQEEEYSSCVTKEEREKILAECAAVSDWLYEDVENPTPELYETRLEELKKLTNVFMGRHWEHEERPEALKALDGMIDGAEKFLVTARNLTKEKNPERDVFTQVEIDVLSKVINDTVTWQRVEVSAQKKLKRNENVRLLVKDITDKMSELDREVKYLVNKIKLWKPKVAPKKPETDKKKKKAKKDSTVNDNEQEADEDVSGTINNENEQAEQSTASNNEDERTEKQEKDEEEKAKAQASDKEQKDASSDKTTPRSDL